MAKRHAPKGRIKARSDDPMSPSDPMSAHVGGDTLHGRKRCTAKSKQTGNQCGRTAIPGGNVCRYHGGAAPQVKKAAMERLKEFQDSALTRLHELAMQEQFPSTAYAAIRDILDRTMGKPAETVNQHVSGGLDVRWQGE